MTTAGQPTDTIESSFLRHRDTILRFLRARGAGDAAEDLLQDLWLRLPRADAGIIDAPLSYLYRMANSLLIDRVRQRQRSERRDADWADANNLFGQASSWPSADRGIEAREEVSRIIAAISTETERARIIFLRHRVDGLTQRETAAEIGVSLGTVEADLRRVYALLAAARSKMDKGSGA